jgi:hypothetical protein
MPRTVRTTTASGGKFAKVFTADPTLEAIQRNAADVFDQLEEHRRQLLSATVVQKAGDYQLGEGMFVEYIGGGGHTFTLPLATVRGQGRAMVVWVANGGGGNLTVAAPGSQTVAGGATLTLATGVMACLVCNGGTKWYRAT